MSLKHKPYTRLLYVERLLDVPVDVSMEVLKKKKAKYAEGKKDQAEGNSVYLENSRACAKWMVEQSNSWFMVECSKGNKFRSIDDIHDDVYLLVKNTI